MDATCVHCGRGIVEEEGRWVDPEAPTDPAEDDHIWRETCDRHETFTAEHEPACDRHGGLWGEDPTCQRCTHSNGMARDLDDKGPLGPGEVKRILHTDMPLRELSLLVSEHARVEEETLHTGRLACFYGWGEAMASPMECKPHHLVFTNEQIFLATIGQTLMDMGYQVVVTDYDEWSKDQVVLRYDNHHQH
jgi:hypothetical protein